ncbi:MAG: hypothetical protein ACI82H_000726 [Alphaproteobacteria bacterium]|jgi:hypothetical protein
MVRLACTHCLRTNPRDGDGMIYIFRALMGIACLAMGFLSPGPARAAEKVDLELVIATDMSYSIDEEEARLQREGVAAAFLSRGVIQAIRNGTHGRIAAAYIDFASTPYNVVVADWHVIRDRASANTFAEKLLKAPSNTGRHTSISSGMDMAAEMIQKNAFDGTRGVIDVSGDGPNNYERRVDIARDQIVAQGITINGLAIMNETDKHRSRYYLPDLDRYFEGCVIGGRGAFMLAATGFRDFARAMKKKLVLEIAGRALPQNPRVMKAQFPGRGYAKGCDIGERMRGRSWGFSDDNP